MNRDFHYDKLVVAMIEQGFTPEEIGAADDKLFEVNQEYYEDKRIHDELVDNGIEPDKTMEQIEYEHTQHLQDFFEDTWGEDAWDERHELYALAE